VSFLGNKAWRLTDMSDRKSQVAHGVTTILNEFPAVSGDVAPPTNSAKVTTTYEELGVIAGDVTLIRDQLPQLRHTPERLNVRYSPSKWRKPTPPVPLRQCY
jgi:hypothetical protein